MFGPRPHHVIWPYEHAPSGSRYCPEADAYVPEKSFYAVRAIKRAPAHPRFWHKLMSRLKHGRRIPMLKMVVAMGVSHANIELISIKEAQRRPEIVYGGFNMRETRFRFRSGSW